LSSNPARRSGSSTKRDRPRKTAARRPSLETELARLLDGRHESLPFATLDHDRGRRTGSPEVVYGSGKTTTQVLAICRRLVKRSGRCLVTRATPEMLRAVAGEFPRARINESAATVFAGKAPVAVGRVCVVSAGTSDLPVAEEAAETLRALGSRVVRLVDVGVAGIHRLLAKSPAIRQANAVIVVAGMEGALPSVVGGLTSKPVFAVPTSIGYGASFRGLAALLAMLNSCAPGVAVVNIDNGFGAAFAAHRVNVQVARARARKPAAGAGSR
jgi:NCAIR mutase (PurE)-related protein